MKKQFLNLGKALSKNEQKQISGGIGGLMCCEWSSSVCIDWQPTADSCPITPKP